MIGPLTLGLIGMVFPTVIALQHFAGLDTIAWLESIWWGSFSVRLLDPDFRTFMGVGLTVFATPVCLYNFWCYQYRLYHRRQGNKEGGFSSGIPVIGSVFLLGAVVVMPESVSWGIAFLVLYAMDAGGPAGIMWYLYSGIGG